MKNLLLVCLIAVLVNACTKKTTENIAPVASTASIVTNGTTFDLGTPTAVASLGVVTIEANKDKSGFTLLLNKNDIKSGKIYDLRASTGFFTFILEGVFYQPNTGSLEITKFTDNKVVEGKFSFEGAAVGSFSKRITASGTFIVNVVL